MANCSDFSALVFELHLCVFNRSQIRFAAGLSNTKTDSGHSQRLKTAALKPH
jgi:hypothetical protein